MDEDQRDRMRLPPDGYVALALVSAVLLEFVAPLPLLPPLSWTSPMLLVGLALAIGGLAIEILAARALSRRGTTAHPAGQPTALATQGVYRWSRNPFYVGMLILVAGLMLAGSLDWIVLCLPVLWLALDRLVVPVEERRLERAFGSEFRNYATTTRRWL